MLLVAVALSQVGEFSFILADVGLEHNLINGEYYQAFLAVSILTMATSPFLLPAFSMYAGWTGSQKLPRWLREG